MVVCLSHTVLHHATTMLVLATVGSIHTWGLAYARVALVAQSVEHQTFNLRAEGSSPFQG